MYVPTAQVGEALTCCVGNGRACGIISLVNRESASYNRYQAGARMAVPPGVIPRLKSMSRDIEVGISSHLREEQPRGEISPAHQVERARRIVAYGERFGYNAAYGRCVRRRGRQRDERRCDEN